MREPPSYRLVHRDQKEGPEALMQVAFWCLGLGSVESSDSCKVREPVWRHSLEVISINEAPVLKLSSQIQVQGPGCSGRCFQMVSRLLPAILMLQMWQRQHFCFESDVTMDFPWDISENYKVSPPEEP